MEGFVLTDLVKAKRQVSIRMNSICHQRGYLFFVGW